MLYRSLSTSKQAIHQLLDRRMRLSEQVGYLLPLIAQIRGDHPTLSCRAMYAKLQPQVIGRDRFEQLCRSNGFSIARKVNLCRTTDSTGVVRFDNLLEGLALTGINEAWSSDITYYEVNNRFYYLTFIMDCFSRRILGYAVSSRLTTEQTTLPALRQAVKARGGTVPSQLIFHSDGGGQYYDQDFLSYTAHHQIRNSMCEFAYENGKSERLNGIIKNNYLKYYQTSTLEQLQQNVDRVVTLYNRERPHKALNYQTPVDYENKVVILQQQTTPTMTGSLDAKPGLNGASSPFQTEQTTPPTSGVLSANIRE
jgi:putative transposase